MIAYSTASNWVKITEGVYSRAVKLADQYDNPSINNRKAKKMKLTFLGTAAANAYPEAFCRCANCERARFLGGPSLRKRSAVLINDNLLIDLGPDIMTASNHYRIPLTKVCYCLQTHAHSDHLDSSHFLSRSPEYGVIAAPRLHFYASAASLKWTAYMLEQDCAPHNFLDPALGERLNLQLHEIEALQSIALDRYQVEAFAANHDPLVESLLYAIRTQEACVFYGIDSGPLAEATWQGFHQHNLQFDLVILDHTYGLFKSGSNHLDAYQFIEHMQRFREEGLLSDRARIFASHISHDGNPPHPELAAFAQQHAYEIAYDGLTVTI